MIKNIFTLIVLLSALNIYSQEFILLKNTNPKAKELKHNLNTAKDSLILNSETKILQIDIFNEDYENIITVNGFTSKISLANIPEGKFVVEAKLSDKTIILGLMRRNYQKEQKNATLPFTNNDIAEGKGMMLDEELNIIKSAPNQSIAYLLTRTPVKKHRTKTKGN
ncbi:hypothetical protein [Winogradskyella ludwigii]|uniref:hypothetical protein n=1 Tax=Winogradskyella ludwigii TaxID=2686076 RepID=UPI0015CC9655|nr:hypothetical protein [Winogradskyella ludwigii]